MQRKGYPFTIEGIEQNLNDVAGVRVICSFIEDIYKLRDALLSQDDVHLVQEKDYIRQPKDNGYRSLHLIIETPIYLTTGKKLVRCEVQLRTIAMDFWASLDHKIKYKQDIPNEEAIEEEMKYSAEMINQLDQRMQQIHNKIREAKDKPYAREKN
jgi:putative GTP pyrophosphokinase